MKLPASLGQKKTKAIEQMLEEVGVGTASFSDALFNVLHVHKCILDKFRHIVGKRMMCDVFSNDVSALIFTARPHCLQCRALY